MLKDDVIQWVKKCQARAMRSVDEEANEYLRKVSKEEDFIREIVAKYNQIVDILAGMEDVSVLFHFNLSFYSGYKYSSFCWDNVETELIFKIITLKSQMYPEQTKFLDGLEKKRRNVKSEYNLLIEKISKFKTTEKAIKYLQELGFDTSTIKSSINAENLFVCGDNKPEGDLKC